MSKPTDDQLRQAIDQIFSKYDKDNSGTLESAEVFNLINDVFSHLSNPRKVTQQEVDGFVKAVDSSGDGKIAKVELFNIFKKVL